MKQLLNADIDYNLRKQDMIPIKRYASNTRTSCAVFLKV